MSYSMTYPTLTPILWKYMKGLDQTIDIGKDKEIEALETMIEGCIKAAESYCNQPLLQKSDYYFFSPIDGESKRYLPYTVPVSVSAVHTRESAFETWAAVSSNDYKVESIGKYTQIHHQNFSKTSTYRITLTVGYTESNIDSSLQQIMLEMAFDNYKKFNDSRFGLVSKAINGAGTNSTTTYKDMLQEFRHRLNAYRIGVV